MARVKKPMATPEQFDGAVLMRVTERNFKVIKFVDISIDRDLLVVGGDNGQGKTTFIDGIEFVHTKKGGPIQGSVRLNPIQDGKQEGSITLDYGDGENVTLSITKTLKRVGDKEYTAEVDIEIPGYMPPSRVQDFLDELCGKQGADPMAFDRMKPAEQLLALRSLVDGFDFDANEAAHAKLFKERTDVGRDRDREQAAANSIDVQDKAPGEKVDETALTAELESAGTKNLEIERRRTNRTNAAARIEELRGQATAALARIDTDIEAETVHCDDFISDQREQIADLERDIAALQAKVADRRTKITEREQQRDAEHVRIREQRQAEAKKATDDADGLAQKFVNAEPLPDPVDAAAITVKLNDARRVNRLIEDWEAQRARKAAHQREADKHSSDYDDMTARLAELEQAKKDAIRKAQLPIDGLGFAADHITLGGVPWVEASEAQRIDASMAIAMASESPLRTILIRHASGVGSRIRERIRQRAHERGYKVIMEVYDETGANSHIFIEDGLVKKIDGQDIPPQEPAPAATGAMEQEPEVTSVTEPAAGAANEPAAPKPKRRWQGPGAPTGGAA